MGEEIQQSFFQVNPSYKALTRVGRHPASARQRWTLGGVRGGRGRLGRGSRRGRDSSDLVSDDQTPGVKAPTPVVSPALVTPADQTKDDVTPSENFILQGLSGRGPSGVRTPRPRRSPSPLWPGGVREVGGTRAGPDPPPRRQASPPPLGTALVCRLASSPPSFFPGDATPCSTATCLRPKPARGSKKI